MRTDSTYRNKRTAVAVVVAAVAVVVVPRIMIATATNKPLTHLRKHPQVTRATPTLSVSSLPLGVMKYG